MTEESWKDRLLKLLGDELADLQKYLEAARAKEDTDPLVLEVMERQIANIQDSIPTINALPDQLEVDVPELFKVILALKPGESIKDMELESFGGVQSKSADTSASGWE